MSREKDQASVDLERAMKCREIFERSTGRYWKRADELERDMTEQFLDYIELNGGKLPESLNGTLSIKANR